MAICKAITQRIFKHWHIIWQNSSTASGMVESIEGFFSISMCHYLNLGMVLNWNCPLATKKHPIRKTILSWIHSRVSDLPSRHLTSQELGQRKIHMIIRFDVVIHLFPAIGNSFCSALVAYFPSIPLGLVKSEDLFVKAPVTPQLRHLKLQQIGSERLPRSFQSSTTQGFTKVPHCGEVPVEGMVCTPTYAA